MSEIAIIIVLILLNGVFSLSEIALVTARKSSLTADAERGSREARLALRLAGQQSRLLSTVQIGITLVGILTGIYSGSTIADDFGLWLGSFGLAPSYAHLAAQTIIVVVVTYLTIVFGELVPKQIALSMAEKASKRLAIPMYALSVLAYPFVSLLSASTNAIVRLAGLKGKESKVTEEEIHTLVREGTEDGTVQPVEEDIVRRVFLVGDMHVDAIMTHRSELTWLDITMTAAEVRNVIKDNMYALYPVAEGDLDHVRGVVTIKDLFLSLGKKDFSLGNIMQTPTYFYENTDIYKALESMKNKRVGYGLVCDEFGACTGIITLKDILTSLVGAGGQEEEPEITPRENGEEWYVDGQCAMYDFLNYFNEAQLMDNEDYNTVAGLCLHQLERVPVCGDKFDWETFQFEIADMDGARIDKLIVRRKKVLGS